jgi:hypothetical protein
VCRPIQLFDAVALLMLIKRFYIPLTLIGTRPSLGVSVSRHAALYVLLSPTGPYIHSTSSTSSDAAGVQGRIALLCSRWAIRSTRGPAGWGGFQDMRPGPGFVAACPPQKTWIRSAPAPADEPCA